MRPKRSTRLTADKPESGLRVKVGGAWMLACNIGWRSIRPRSATRSFERDGARLIVDKKSFLYSQRLGTRLWRGFMAAGFRLVNPNAKRTCGCGEILRRLRRQSPEL